jgi:hypothetical protein
LLTLVTHKELDLRLCGHQCYSAVKKNAIMMIDLAIEFRAGSQRHTHLAGLPAAFPSDHDGTGGSLFGTLPIALVRRRRDARQPLGLAVVAGWWSASSRRFT